MSKIIKIIVFMVFFIFLSLYYIFYTATGQKQGYFALSYYVSHKLGLESQVTSIDFSTYPYMKANLLIEDKYTLNLDGFYENKNLNLRYTLTSTCLESNVCNIKDDVQIKGHIRGKLGHLKIDGLGTALEGDISYVGIKQKHAFKNVDIVLTDINSTKLFTLLGQDALLNGKANGSLHFNLISKKHRKGTLYYEVKDQNFHGVPLSFNTQVNIDDKRHTFHMNLDTPNARLHLLQGKYNQKTKKAEAVYLLDVKNVTALKKLLHLDYDGSFYSVGKVKYDKQISIQGFSKSLGGMIDLVFKDNTLHYYLHDVPLSPLMKKLDVLTLFDTQATGQGQYNLTKKTASLNVNLSPLHFKQNKHTKMLFQKSDIDLSKELFQHNTLTIKSLHGKVETSLILANEHNHLKFINSKIDAKRHTFESNIDLKLNTYNIKGDLFLKIDTYTSANDTYVKFDGHVQKHYALKLKGLLNDSWTSMDYSLSAARLPSHICTIVDDVNITGHLNGAFNRLHIEGTGKALNGIVSYEAVKMGEKFEDVTINISNVHAQKLSTLFGHPELPFGKVDIEAYFDVLSTQRQKGDIHYKLYKSTLFTLPFSLDTDIEIDNKNEKFKANINLANAKIQLTKGSYLIDSNQSKFVYTLDVKDLTSFETLLGYKYKGPFYAMGTVNYDGDYNVHGLSKTFNGFTEFNYTKDQLNIDLSNVSLKHIMNLFPYPLMIEASTSGKIQYDFTQKKLFVKTALKDAKFIYSDLIETVYQKSGVNMLKETFTNSKLDITYQNDVLLGNLIMANEKSHFSLTNTQMDAKNNTINAYFDVKMQKKEFSGKVYGSLDNPKVNLNMQKLIRHEMDKQLDSIMGEGNRKMMENMPMGGAAKDMASGVGGAFMGMFF
jgi:hypothetical protein